MSVLPAREPRRAIGALLTTAIVVLTLSTAYIHSTLGGMLFTLNAVGYAVAAVAIVVGAVATLPIVVRFSWLPRIGLFGYTVVTIVGWAVSGDYYQLAYITKAIEVGLLALLLVDSFRVYGGPAGLVTAALASIRETIGSIRR